MMKIQYDTICKQCKCNIWSGDLVVTCNSDDVFCSDGCYKEAKEELEEERDDYEKTKL